MSDQPWPFYLKCSTVALLVPSHHNIMLLVKMNRKFESEPLSTALPELPPDLSSDNLPLDNLPQENLPLDNLPSENLPPELLQLIFSNLPPQSLKYDFPYDWVGFSWLPTFAWSSSHPPTILPPPSQHLPSLILQTWTAVYIAALHYVNKDT